MYDAILILSFGGPEGPDDVIPFLENVLRGRHVPRERMLEVAEHYYHFGGVSPINRQCRELASALSRELARQGSALPVYGGNRNWHPLLPDTLRQMRDDGIRHALALVTSIFSSYSGCRQYLEDIERARQQVGAGAPQVDKLRVFYNHPDFIAAMQDRVAAAIDQIPAARLPATQLVFTAHSIPRAMASSCAYEAQLRESCRLVAVRFPAQRWQLVYQSRSGPPAQPWLEPDICDYLRQARRQSDVTDVLIVPIGFVSDHIEVLYDLDTEAHRVGRELGLNVVRAGTVGTHPRFVQMIASLIAERTRGAPRQSLGLDGPSPDTCHADCCAWPGR